MGLASQLSLRKGGGGGGGGGESSSDWNRLKYLLKYWPGQSHEATSEAIPEVAPEPGSESQDTSQARVR